MMRAASIAAVLLAVPAWGDPAGTGSRFDTHPYGILSLPIDLSTGFHQPQMPPASEYSSVSVPRERESESAGSPEFSARTFGLARSGLAGVMNKRQHDVPTIRLKGVTLFGGSIAGTADGRSARVFFTWPTDH